MSMWVPCPKCGEDMEVPAFPGDGVFSRHICKEKENFVNELYKKRKRWDEDFEEEASLKRSSIKIKISVI
jgi:hypothetical protein